MKYIIFIVILISALHHLFNKSKQPKYSRLMSSNWLSDAYDIFNDKIYPFKYNISEREQEYIQSIVNGYNHEDEFKNGHEISPYSFSLSIDKTTGRVNPTRINVGSVEKNIQPKVTKLLKYIQVNETPCTSGFKYYGIGWDLVDRIIKIYTIKDREKIECFVYKVNRNDKNEIISSSFHTKKSYDIGKKNTIMYKNGTKIDQINTSRVSSKNFGFHKANAWIKKMQGLGFIFDTFSDYDGKINLYFD